MLLTNRSQSGNAFQFADQRAKSRIAESKKNQVLNTEVTVSKEEVAGAQMQSEVKQRLIGFLPNYYVVYFKIRLPQYRAKKAPGFPAFRRSSHFRNSGRPSGERDQQQRLRNIRNRSRGLRSRYAAAYADGFIGTMIGSGLC
jgi:hypothetical protein